MSPGQRSAAGLLAATAVNLPFGTLYAFSVFLTPVEAVARVACLRAACWAQQRGLAKGYVVSPYPLGAMLGAPILGWGIQAFGVRATLASLGVAMLAGCAIPSTFLRTYFSSRPLRPSRSARRHSSPRGRRGAHRGRLAGRSLRARAGRHGGPAPMLARQRNRFEPRADAAERGLAAGAIAQYWHKNQFGLVASRLYIAWCAAAVSFPVLAGRSSIAPEATRRQHGSPPASTSSARA